jgi:hypothetical protein
MSQQGQWQVAGSAPEVYEQELVPAVFGPWAPILLELAYPKPGDRVIDIACGTEHISKIAPHELGRQEPRLVLIWLCPTMVLFVSAVMSDLSPECAPKQTSTD